MEVCCPHGCSICPLPITSTAIPQSPFISCLSLQQSPHRWAVVICHTLQCQQQPQDEWLRSSVVLWTPGCSSFYTQKSEPCNRTFPLPVLKLYIWRDGCNLWNELFSRYAPASEPFRSCSFFVFSLWETDMPTFFSQPLVQFPLTVFCLDVCVRRSAPPMAPRPPTMM